MDCLDLAKQNGITLLSFPPHCSHKLQPLDRSVYGPLKRFYNAACDDWVVSNPRPMTIFDIVGIVSKAYAKAFTPSNITAGFKVAGIEPFNANIFNEDEFLASYVTDRPEPVDNSQSVTVAPGQSVNTELIATGEDSGNNESVTVDQTPSENDLAALVVASENNELITMGEASGNSELIPPGQALVVTSQSTINLQSSLEKLKPYPKAAARKTARGRQQQRTRILTDTHVINEIRMRQENKRKKPATAGNKRKGTQIAKINKSGETDKQSGARSTSAGQSSIADAIVDPQPSTSSDIQPFATEIGVPSKKKRRVAPLIKKKTAKKD